MGRMNRSVDEVHQHAFFAGDLHSRQEIAVPGEKNSGRDLSLRTELNKVDAEHNVHALLNEYGPPVLLPAAKSEFAEAYFESRKPL
ncbi:MAG: hypothetical protein CHACPFDD_03825 [Phycisphaerae bacterium]|nr:hypothetical protein [Phycisphaerae bacterium]